MTNKNLVKIIYYDDNGKKTEIEFLPVFESGNEKLSYNAEESSMKIYSFFQNLSVELYDKIKELFLMEEMIDRMIK